MDASGRFRPAIHLEAIARHGGKGRGDADRENGRAGACGVKYGEQAAVAQVQRLVDQGGGALNQRDFHPRPRAERTGRSHRKAQTVGALARQRRYCDRLVVYLSGACHHAGRITARGGPRGTRGQGQRQCKALFQGTTRAQAGFILSKPGEELPPRPPGTLTGPRWREAAARLRLPAGGRK